MIVFKYYFCYFSRFVRKVVLDYMEDSLLTWLLVAVCNGHRIKNPYLVAKIVEVLFVMDPAISLRTENIYTRVMAHPVSQRSLPRALMKFYTEIETTGQSTEFYDKFTIR